MRASAGALRAGRSASERGCWRACGASRPRNRRVLVQALFGGGKQAKQVAVDPSPPVCAPCQWSSGLPIAAAAAATFGAAYFWKIKAESKRARRQQLEPWPEIPRPDADPRAYQLALARTRQALAVQKAVAFMKAGEPARSLVELHRALEENAVCRSPLLDGHQTRGELRDLYKLHLLNTPVPHSFATLLQLRELLGISPQEGEDIEVQVLELGTAFSI